MEVAIRALSSGINDPGTAILSLQSITELLVFRLKIDLAHYIRDSDGKIRVIMKERSFADLFNNCIQPIWDYGKEDRLFINEMHHLLIQLQSLQELDEISNLLTTVEAAKLKIDL